MASRLASPPPIQRFQHERFVNQSSWVLYGLCLYASEKPCIAVSGDNEGNGKTFIDLYFENERNSDSRDQPKRFYSKEFDAHPGQMRRLVAFLGNPHMIVTCLGDRLEIFKTEDDKILRSCKITGKAQTLAVREFDIFIGLWKSRKVKVYNENLDEVKSIFLVGIQEDNYPLDMTVVAGRIFIRAFNYKTFKGRALSLKEKDGKLISEFKNTTRQDSRAWGITVSLELLMVSVLWDWNQILLYSYVDNRCFLVIDIDTGVDRIRISDRSRLTTGNWRTGEVKLYNVAELFSYSILKGNLVSILKRDDCEKLATFFGMSKEQSDYVLKSDTGINKFVHALEEKGVMHHSNVDKLARALVQLNISPFCSHVTEIYQRTRMQTTLYGRFLATLSTHLTASLPAMLCDFFNISDEKKDYITCSQNPGLFVLLALDELGVIKPSEVGILQQPLSEFNLVQAVALIHDYQSTTEDECSLVQLHTDLTIEGKTLLLVQLLRKKIRNWFETTTLVPWMKSCKWKSAYLFVSTGLILTHSTNKRSLTDIDEQCKIEYSQIFTHEKLKLERRIILEGDPGCGKTVLVSQLAYDWSLGKFDDIGILILLPLKIVEDKTIVQAVKDFYFPQNRSISVDDIEMVLMNKDQPCHLLLDGLEEYNAVQKVDGEQTEVMQIMLRKKYPSCKVVITARSDFAQSLPPSPMLKLGKFGEAERNSYIDKVFGQNTEKQFEMMRLFSHKSLLADLCSVPLLFVLVVHNMAKLKILQKDYLQRVTPFMKDMINVLRDSSESLIKSADHSAELPTSSLEELAFNGLCKGRQQLSWNKEFIEAFVANLREWIDCGVIIVEESNVLSVNPIDSSQLESSLDENQDDDKHERRVESNQESQAVVSSVASHPQEESVLLDVGTFKAEETNLTEQKVGLRSLAIENPTGTETLPQGPQSTFSGLTATHVPLQVRFLHKIIQEWFAAKYFVSNISKQKGIPLTKYLNQILPLINPADLHFVLRFTCGLYPTCCSLVVSFLLDHYRPRIGELPGYIADCAFLCFAEYDGVFGYDILKVVEEICKETTVIHCDDSRHLQHAKVSLLEVASNHGVSIKKLLLQDLVEAAQEDELTFNSGVVLKVLDTVEMVEVCRWDQRLQEKDYINIIKFVTKCVSIKQALLHFPDKAPEINIRTLANLDLDDKIVTWIIGPRIHHFLNPETGKWMIDGGEHLSEPEIYSTRVYDYDDETICEVEAKITHDGGCIKIPNTELKLTIPPYAIPKGLDWCSIQIKIIQPEDSDVSTKTFAGNSSVNVMILPSNLQFRLPVQLILPHCLQLVENAEWTANIYTSYHEKGSKPEWKKLSGLPYTLSEKSCTVLLESTCSVKLEIDDKIVEAKRIQVYAAGRYLHAWDSFAEMEVGYYPDLPGGSEILRSKKHLVVADRKPFIYYRRDQMPLEAFVKKCVPKGWRQDTADDNPKQIPFEAVALSLNHPCRFTFVKESGTVLFPSFILKVSQGKRSFRLITRPKILSQENLSNLSETVQDKSLTVDQKEHQFFMMSLPGTSTQLTRYPATKGSTKQIEDEAVEEISMKRSKVAYGITPLRGPGKSQIPSDTDMTLDEFIYKEQYVDKHGGVLIVPEANISLHVPPGAVRNGVILSITVLRDSNSFLSGTGVQSKVTPQVICEPDGITFLTPVELILPHCAVVDKPEVQKVTVYFGNKKKHFDKEMTWSTEPVKYKLTEHFCHIYLNHFTGVAVDISNIEEKILRVIPYAACEDDANDFILTVWLCNDLESDFQSLMQSEDENGYIPLDSYDTFRLQHGEHLQHTDVLVTLEKLGATKWLPKETEEKIGVHRLSTATKSKCTFRICNTSSSDSDYIYLALRVSQKLSSDLERETMFILRKQTCDLKMPLPLKKPYLLGGNETCILSPSGKPPCELPQTCTAALYMDPVKNYADDVILTLWLCSCDSESPMFKSFHKEQEFHARHKVDTENSITIFDDKNAIVTKPRFRNGEWLLTPEQKIINAERVKFGRRAKFQFIGQNRSNQSFSVIDLEVETFQKGRNKIRFMKKVQLDKLLHSENVDGGEVTLTSPTDDASSHKYKVTDKGNSKTASEDFKALCKILEENLSKLDCQKLGEYFSLGSEEQRMVELSQTSSSRILSILQEKRAFTIQKVGPIQNGLREIQRDDLAEEVITFKKRTPEILGSFGALLVKISHELSLRSTLEVATMYGLSPQLMTDIEAHTASSLKLLHVLVEKGLVTKNYTSSLKLVLTKIGNLKAAELIDLYNNSDTLNALEHSEDVEPCTGPILNY